MLFLFSPPPPPRTCEISFTSEKKLLLLTLSMASAADAPGTKVVVKTLFNPVHTEPSVIYKLKILSNESHFLAIHWTLSLNYFYLTVWKIIY